MKKYKLTQKDKEFLIIMINNYYPEYNVLLIFNGIIITYKGFKIRIIGWAEICLQLLEKIYSKTKFKRPMSHAIEMFGLYIQTKAKSPVIHLWEHFKSVNKDTDNESYS